VPDWEPVVGLEIHVQLKTRTKLFCRCELAFGAPPNSRTCPVCLAHPGTLPVPNGRAIEWTILLGLALGCEVAQRAVFHRKNYFYRDLPKGYQISQYDEPLCVDGRFVLPGPDGDAEIGIVRAHLEEDAAKSVHVGGTGGRSVGAAYSLVDFNRGGTPLVEIVTQPDLRSSEQARRFLQLLRQTIVELGISDAEMEKGSLRVDANVSVREAGETGLRTRWELKNMNSFAYIARGIEKAVAEQVALHEAGEEVVQQTYDYDADRNRLTPHRSKEEADDYRYFPEPDLVPVEPARELVERLRGELPELPGARVRRIEELGVPFEEAAALNATPPLVRLLEKLDQEGVAARTGGTVLLNDLAPTGVDPDRVDATELGQIISSRDLLTRSAYQGAMAASASESFRAADYLSQTVTADTDELEPLVDRILAANESQVAAYRAGKEGLLGFFVGQVMRETQGKADPRAVNELLREKLRG
jgi:aspartyl-tRNA(Asn)/glutamyl-tRNA(Gln) amidotransferase subunit B